jgi:hypothetical protein
MRRLALAFVSLSLVALLFGCANGSNAGSGNGGASANLVFTASSPSTGNATLDNAAVTYDPNADSSGYDRLTVAQTVGGIDHTFYFYFTPSSGAPHSAQHVWTGANIAQCIAPDCVAANAVVNASTQTVTFNNLVLTDALGGATTSTVTGTISW